MQPKETTAANIRGGTSVAAATWPTLLIATRFLHGAIRTSIVAMRKRHQWVHSRLERALSALKIWPATFGSGASITTSHTAAGSNLIRMAQPRAPNVLTAAAAGSRVLAACERRRADRIRRVSRATTSAFGSCANVIEG